MKEFDWAGLIATEFPSAADHASPIQRARHELYVRALQETDEWCNRHELTELWPVATLSYRAYLDASSYHSACRTLDPRQTVHARLFPRYLMWFSAVDLLLDDIVLPRLAHSERDAAEQAAYVDTVLWRIAGPLLRDTDAHERAGVQLGVQNAPSACDVDADEDMLRRIVGGLTAFLDELPPETTDAGRRLLVDEMVLALGAQRNEIMTALESGRSRALPDMADYLDSSWNYLRTLLAPSYVFIPGVADDGAFSQWLPAAVVGGRAARLANDNGTFIREQDEGKPSSVTITLAALGYPVDGSKG